LNGVTYDGTLTMSSNSQSATIQNGLTLANNGTVPGAINFAGVSDSLFFQGTQTLDNTTVTLGNGTSAYADVLYVYDPAGTGATLTLGQHLTVDVKGYSGDSLASYFGYATDGIVNQGTITDEGVTGRGGALTVSSPSFTNVGTIAVSNGSALNLSSSTSLTNSGTIAISDSGSTVSYGANGKSWTNTGTITVGSGTTLRLYGTYTTAQLANIGEASGGSVAIDGTLTNTGTTLNVGTGQLPSVTLASDGTIVGGAIADAGGGLTFSGGALNGVTYDGTLTMSSNSQSATIQNGLTLANNGTIPGGINFAGVSDSLFFQGTQTLDNTIVTLGNGTSAYADVLYVYDPGGTGATLTLGQHLTLDVKGYSGNSLTSYYGYSTDGIVNQGTIDVDGVTGRGGALTVSSPSFTNSGTVNVTNGSQLTIQSTAYVDSGTLNANGGNVLVMGTDTGGGNATISGTSSIQYNGASNENVTFASGSTGELFLIDSVAFTGKITGFTGSGTPTTSDKIDLRDINFNAAGFKGTYANNVLTITDGTHTANLNFVGSYVQSNFKFSADGSGGTLLIDPQAPGSADTVISTSYDGQVALLRQHMASSFASSLDGGSHGDVAHHGHHDMMLAHPS
jgi:hypothetical protein